MVRFCHAYAMHCKKWHAHIHLAAIVTSDFSFNGINRREAEISAVMTRNSQIAPRGDEINDIALVDAKRATTKLSDEEISNLSKEDLSKLSDEELSKLLFNKESSTWSDHLDSLLLHEEKHRQGSTKQYYVEFFKWMTAFVTMKNTFISFTAKMWSCGPKRILAEVNFKCVKTCCPSCHNDQSLNCGCCHFDVDGLNHPNPKVKGGFALKDIFERSAFFVMCIVCISVAINICQYRYKNELDYSWSRWIFVVYAPFVITLFSDSLVNDAIARGFGLTLVGDRWKYVLDFLLITVLSGIALCPLWMLSALTNGNSINYSFGERGCEEEAGCEIHTCPTALHVMLSFADYSTLLMASVAVILINNSMETVLKERLRSNYLYVRGDGGLKDILRIATKYVDAVAALSRGIQTFKHEVVNMKRCNQEVGKAVDIVYALQNLTVQHIHVHKEFKDGNLRKILKNLDNMNSFGICSFPLGQQLTALNEVNKVRRIVCKLLQKQQSSGNDKQEEDEKPCGKFEGIVFNPAQDEETFKQVLLEDMNTRLKKLTEVFGDLLEEETPPLWVKTGQMVSRYANAAEQLQMKLTKYAENFGTTFARDFSFSSELKNNIGDNPHTTEKIGRHVETMLLIKAVVNLTTCVLTLITSYFYAKNSDENVGFILILVLYSCLLNLSSAKVVNTQEVIAEKVEVAYTSVFKKKKSSKRIFGFNTGTQSYYYFVVGSSLLTIAGRSLSLTKGDQLEVWKDCLLFHK